MDSEKPSKVDPKGDGQPSKKQMVVEPAFDFRLQFTTNRKFSTQQEMQNFKCLNFK
jgi:hypothetical protein